MGSTVGTTTERPQGGCCCCLALPLPCSTLPKASRLQGHRKDTGAARLSLGSREGCQGWQGNLRERGCSCKRLQERVGKQGSENARGSLEQPLLLPSPSHGHSSHSWGDSAASDCISLCWGALGTADSKAEGPNSAQYPPNEGQRARCRQEHNLVTSLPGKAAAAAVIRAARTAFCPNPSPNPAVAAAAWPGWQSKHPVCPSAGTAFPDPAVPMFAKCLQRQALTSGCLCATLGG